MIALETLVRPFATPTATFTPRTIASSQKQAAQIARLHWGQVGTLPTPVSEASPYLNFKVVNATNFSEVPGARKTTNVTVANPNDSSQYVVVQRVDQTQFSGPAASVSGGTSDGATSDYTAYSNSPGTTDGSGNQSGGTSLYTYSFDNTANQSS